MFKKLTVAIIIMAMTILWSAVAIAAEKEGRAGRSKEAQIQQIKGEMKDIEIAIERESNVEKKAALKKSLQEQRKKLSGLMGKSPAPQKPKGNTEEIEKAIRRARGNLRELRQAIAASKEKGDQPDKLKELQKKLGQEEKKLVEYNELLKKRAAEAKPKRPRAQSRLMFFQVKYANAAKLADIIEKFLTPEGIIAADPDSNTLIIKDLPAGMETASQIIKALDVQRRRGAPRAQPQRRDQPQQRREQPQARREQPKSRQESRERAERENVFMGKVLAANKESLTMETRDGKKNVILYVPTRKKEDGTQALLEDLSMMVSKLEIGSSVRVQWRQGDVKRFIVRVSKIEGEASR